MTTAEYLGGGSVGGHMPTALQGFAAGTAAINATLPGASARLSGTLAATAAVGISPPSFTAVIEAANNLIIAAQAGISGPSVQVDVAAMGAAAAALAVEVGALEAALSLLAGLSVLYGTAGVHAYLVDGEIGSHGSALQGALSNGVPGGSGSAQLGTGFYLVAADNGAISALRAIFAT